MEVASEDIRPFQGVFLVIIVLLVAGFILTGFIVRGHKARQQQLAQRWFSRGDRDLSRGASREAVDDFQTALAYAPENDAFRLKLALALMQAGREDEARVHLVSLWEARPGDSNVNLQLARVMARLGRSEEAVRYYHGAIYGVWDADPLAKRQAARFELAKYLLSTRRTNAAESELIALAAESPINPQSEVQLGDMLMEAGDPTRALSAYLHARKGPHDATANLGAARASFALHRFREAREFARDAYRSDPRLEEASMLEQQADSILKADPQLDRLSPRDRAERAYKNYSAAAARLSGCSAAARDPILQQLLNGQQTQFKRLSASALLRDPDLLQQAIQWTYEVEKATEGVCGAPSGLDAALLILAHFQGAR
jgi:predicted Zn-dependent protease